MTGNQPRPVAGDLPLRFAGGELLLLPERAAWWPAGRTLLVADLHWGKHLEFRRAGIPLPEGDMAAELDQLAALVQRLNPRRLMVLGDLIHSDAARDRSVQALVLSWRKQLQQLEIDLVRGNHDRHMPVLPAPWNIRPVPAGHSLGPWRLHHEPPNAAGPQGILCGHLHPTVRLGGRDSLRLPCFHARPRQLVLPAFARMTNGPAVPRRPGEQAYAIAGGQVVGVWS